MALNARVLIVSRDDQLAGAMGANLAQLGWPSVTARGLHSALATLVDHPLEAAIVYLDGDEVEICTLARRLKAEWAPQHFPILGLGRFGAVTDGADPFDLTLAPPLDANQAAQRLHQLLRAAIAEEEFELRDETFASHGRRLERPAPDDRPLRVLTIGEPAPKFLALSHALKQHGVEITGAFTAYTAFDYLHDRTFDAVALWGGETQDEALSIVAGMRRNARLYHLPTVLYLRSSSDLDLAEAFRRGLSDVAAADTLEEETALRVMALARAYRREMAVRRALEKARGSGLMDSATGLFTRELFAAHLARLSDAARARHRPLSVSVLRIANQPEIIRARTSGWLDRALPQIGSMIARLVRAEDTAARITSEVFALALPGASVAAARTAAERIAAVIACTAFPSGPNQPAFTVNFQVGAAELHAGESAARALERAAVKSMAKVAS